MNQEPIFVKVDAKTDSSKPGRELVCQPLDEIKGVKTVYTVKMERGSHAGDHYHLKKIEVLFCIHGIIVVYLADKDDPTNTAVISLSENEGIKIRPGIAHRVESMYNGIDTNKYISIIQVFSTGTPRAGDDYEFDVMAAVNLPTA